MEESKEMALNISKSTDKRISIIEKTEYTTLRRLIFNLFDSYCSDLYKETKTNDHNIKPIWKDKFYTILRRYSQLNDFCNNPEQTVISSGLSNIVHLCEFWTLWIAIQNDREFSSLIKRINRGKKYVKKLEKYKEITSLMLKKLSKNNRSKSLLLNRRSSDRSTGLSESFFFKKMKTPRRIKILKSKSLDLSTKDKSKSRTKGYFVDTDSAVFFNSLNFSPIAEEEKNPVEGRIRSNSLTLEVNVENNSKTEDINGNSKELYLFSAKAPDTKRPPIKDDYLWKIKKIIIRKSKLEFLRKKRNFSFK